MRMKLEVAWIATKSTCLNNKIIIIEIIAIVNLQSSEKLYARFANDIYMTERAAAALALFQRRQAAWQIASSSKAKQCWVVCSTAYFIKC